MPYYSFNMKKGKYQLEMMSDDIYFAVRQVDKLIEKLMKTRGRLRVVLPPIEQEESVVEQKINKTKVTDPPKLKEEFLKEPVMAEEQELRSVEKTKKIVESEEEISSSVEDSSDIKQVDEILKKQFVKEEQNFKPVFEESTEEVQEKKLQEIIKEKPADLTVEMAEESIEEIFSQEIVKETFEEAAEEEPEENLFEKILTEKTMETAVESKEEEFDEKPVEQPQKTKKGFNFKKIIKETLKAPEIKKSLPQIDEADEIEAVELEEEIANSINSVESEEIVAPVITEKAAFDDENEIDIRNQEFDSLGQLIAVKNPQSKIDYLLLAAYYLQTKENLFKYSLKQLNSKVMPFLGVLIDHSIIHNAVAHDFIEVVPDYNGTAEVTEYRLTSLGEEYLVNEL